MGGIGDGPEALEQLDSALRPRRINKRYCQTSRIVTNRAYFAIDIRYDFRVINVEADYGTQCHNKYISMKRHGSATTTRKTPMPPESILFLCIPQ
jgi:hypothetical protein